jgi:hypothetical protein
MKRPKDRGAAMDLRRFNGWLVEFATYAHTVTQRGIELWLEQFAEEDRDVAARVLDCIYFAGADHIQQTFRRLLNAMRGWSADENKRRGRWFFVAFSGSAGESGDRMLHDFRLANDLAARKFDRLFVHRSELVGLRLGPQDTLVFVDDFAATGNQACDSWKNFFSELLTEGPRIFLMLVAATDAAIRRIRDETDMSVTAGRSLADSDNLFSNQCEHFSVEEKARVLQYCERASRKYPKGWGDIGALVVFAHRCPNSSLAILHSESRDWDPLFRR